MAMVALRQRRRLRRISPILWTIGIRDIFLRNSTQIDNRIRNTIRPSERYYHSSFPPMACAVIERYVAAAIAHQGTGVESVNQLERGKLVAARGAGEGLGDTG